MHQKIFVPRWPSARTVFLPVRRKSINSLRILESHSVVQLETVVRDTGTPTDACVFQQAPQGQPQPKDQQRPEPSKFVRARIFACTRGARDSRRNGQTVNENVCETLSVPIPSDVAHDSGMMSPAFRDNGDEG
jgi:hypothetical protein